MKCFFYFKNKSRSRRHQRSAPELKGELESDFSGCSRTAASSCSLTSTRSVPKLYEEKAHNLRVFSFAEMREATHDFNRLLKIGQGGFGSVFKGSIKPIDGKGDPLVVAIKQLSKDGLQVCFSLNLLGEFLLFVGDSDWVIWLYSFHIRCIKNRKSLLLFVKL